MCERTGTALHSERRGRPSGRLLRVWAHRQWSLSPFRTYGLGAQREQLSQDVGSANYVDCMPPVDVFDDGLFHIYFHDRAVTFDGRPLDLDRPSTTCLFC